MSFDDYYMTELMTDDGKAAVKVLIATNPLDHEGGVVNYYRLFFKHFSNKNILLEHAKFGSRMQHFYSRRYKVLLYPLYYIFDLVQYFRRIAFDSRVRIIQVSPSLIPVPLLRDAFIIIIAKLFRRRVIVFFRGWKCNVVEFLKRRYCFRAVFRLVYGRADKTIVLASSFRNDLLGMGWEAGKIHVTTTMYDATEVLPYDDRTGRIPRFLFLGRVSQLKGIGELIEACRILANRRKDFECVIAGHGDHEDVLKDYETLVATYGLKKHVRLTGRVIGRDKYSAYAENDVYVFPSWTEGCPNSVLEALGAGLFVISTAVGALRDIIREGENGRIVRCKDPEHLAAAMEWAIEHIENLRGRRRLIKTEAEESYDVQIICRQFVDLYQRMIHD